MTFARTLALAGIGLVSACLASAEIRIKDLPPNMPPLNGQAVPSTATFSPALTSGESLVVSVEGRDALQVNVFEGQITKLSSRFKMSASGEISYRRITMGAVQESATQQVVIKGGMTTAGEAATLTKDPKNFREKAAPGKFRCLAFTKNGFGNVLVLADRGFRVELIGTNAVSNNMFFEVEGSFSETVQSSLAEAPTPFLR